MQRLQDWGENMKHKQDTKMSKEQKIKHVRIKQGISQETLGKGIGSSKSKIGRIECEKDKNQDSKYTEDELRLAKEFLDIENAPFTNEELDNFRKRLYRWNDLTKNGHLVEARNSQQEFEVITKLDFEKDLILLYKMFEVRLLLKERNNALAEEMLMLYKPELEEADSENGYHFHYNMGSLYMLKSDFESALVFYLKAYSLEVHAFEREVFLQLNIATCYSKLGRYVFAITSLLEAEDSFNHDKTHIAWTYIDNLLALNHIRIGQIEKGRKRLHASLEEAIRINDTACIAYVYHNHGVACFVENKYKEAIAYFDKAFTYYKDNNAYFLECHYYKIRCTIAMRKISDSKTLLQNAEKLAKGNDHYTLMLKSLNSLLTLSNKNCVHFIQETTIPYLIDKYEYFKALDFCKELEKEFTGKEGYKAKLAEIVSVIRDTQYKIAFGEEVIVQ